MGGNLMNLLFLASEVNELEEAFRELQEKYDEIYLYTKLTFYLLLAFLIIKVLSFFVKALFKEAVHYENSNIKNQKPDKLKNEIDNNQ